MASKSGEAPSVALTDSIGARFAETAGLHADRIAIKTPEEAISYRDLNARANLVAHSVLENEAEAPGRIALLFEQGADAIAATLGVLKTGHAFVPLDSADPVPRLQTIVSNCQPLAIVTDDRHVELADHISGGAIPVRSIDSLGDGASSSAPQHSVSPDAIAYIFYTSGSTGRPKGVLQTHRNLGHFVRVYGDTLGLCTDDRSSLLYSLSFSASNMDVFSTLLTGATLYPYDIRTRGTAGLADWLDAEGITILHAVPTVFRHLMASMPTGRRLNSVRAIDLGGEAVHPSDVALYRDRFGKDCLLFNHLAATEASVIAQHRVDRDRVYEADTIPVGLEASGVRIQVVREDGSPAAPGETGELIISSEFLSTGYWRQPNLTETAFDVDEENPGRRTYRTGDLGSLDAAGELYHLGRRDLRVKIRGHSVDTAEVEAAFRTLGWIRDVAVLPREDREKGQPQQLIAFVVCDDPERGDSAELRRSLQDLLAAYMIPSEFVFVASLPVTASGKIDRMSLSIPQSHPHRSGRDFDAPKDDLETAIAELFGSVLGIERVGRSDDFFLLGGDSLNATGLHAALQDMFGLDLAIQNLFGDATVSGMAELVRIRQQGEADNASISPVIVPLRRTGSRRALFLAHGLNGQAFVSPQFLDLLGADQPVYALQAKGLDRSRHGHDSIEGMAVQYLEAIRRIQPTGPYFLVSLCAGCMLTIEMARMLRHEGEEFAPLLFIDPYPNPRGDRNRLWRYKDMAKIRLRQILYRDSTSNEVVQQLRRVKAMGRVSFKPGTRAIEEAVRVAYAFEFALLRYQLTPYDGPVIILGTELWSPGRETPLRDKFLGDVTLLLTDGPHYRAHDPDNEGFQRALRRGVEMARAAIES